MEERNRTFFMQQTYATLFSLTNKVQVQGDQYFKHITLRQFMAMVAIAHLPCDSATLNGIARKLGTAKQSTKQIVDNLQRKGYVEIAQSVNDKRAVNVRITEAGLRVMDECNQTGMRFLQDLFRAFSDAQLQTLWEMLKRLYRFDGQEQDGFEDDATVCDE